MRLLLIEDDKDSASYLIKGLMASGYQVDHFDNGREGLTRAINKPYDLMIIDRMLPEIDGLSIIESLRAAKVKTPVLILSALAAVDDRVKGLKVGGDDYLTKPFAFSELLARVEVLLRRSNSSNEKETKLRVADLEIDLLSRRVHRGGVEIEVQPREFLLLEFLMRNHDKVVTRTLLLENVWDYHFDPQTNVIEVHMSRLRQKIDRGSSSPLLHTVRGSGYCLRSA